jgi:hypothetical protein
MSTVKKIVSPKNDVNINRLKALKKLGILKEIKAPTKNAPLTSNQKSKIRDTYKKLGVVINSPPENFQKIDLKKYQKRDVENLKKTGYIVYGDKAFIGKQGYDKVSITREYIKSKDGSFDRVFNIVRKTKDGRKIEEEMVGTPLEKMEWRDRLRKEFDLKKMKKGEFFGLKVFDNGIFERRIFTDFDDMMHYVGNDMRMHTPKDVDMIRDNLHVIKLTVKDYRDLALTEKTEKKKNRTAYFKKKNSKLMRGQIKRK